MTENSVSLAESGLVDMSKVERLKIESEGLFYISDDAGKRPVADDIDALTRGDAQTVTDTVKEIGKFFGFYKQRERDSSGRKTGDYIFMLRLKNPAGGELSPQQWRGLNDATERYANGTLRLTSREGIQFHYVYGRDLVALIRHLNFEFRDQAYQLTTLGACGDVSRNTMCSPIDDLDADLPLDSRNLAYGIATELAPRSSAYYQVFLSDDEGRNIAPVSIEEPIYGPQYLPRKFKVGIAHPHDNSVEVLTQDVGFVPIVCGTVVDRFDLYSGGGLGSTHNHPETKQLLGLYLGRVPRAQVVATVRAIALLQREHGERKNRRLARWKYTIRRLGTETVKQLLRERFGIALTDAAPQPLPSIRYHHGWFPEAGDQGRFYFGLPVEHGRLQDTAQIQMRTAVLRIVEELKLGVRITPNQDLLLCHIPGERREWVERLLREYGVLLPPEQSQLRKFAIACPAKPTCGLAMTDAERLLPVFVQALEQAGLGDVDVIIRMAGCPNACSRPSTAEIGIMGYGKNDYVIQVGGSRQGARIGKILYERLPEASMIPILSALVRAIRDHNPQNLPAGDFLHLTPVDELRRLVSDQENAAASS